MLQRRFNFFDYAADGQLNGAVTIAQFRVLAHNLLPAPDAFVVVDRPRSSVNGYLLSPTPDRDYANLQHLKPNYVWVPATTVARYKNVSPARFHVGRGQLPGAVGPVFTLFESGGKKATKTTKTATNAVKKTGSTGTGSNAGASTTGGSNSTVTATTTQTNSSTTPPTANDLVNTIKSIAGVSKTSTAANQSPKLGTPQPAGSIVAQTTGSTTSSNTEVASFSPTSTGSNTVQEKSAIKPKKK